MNMGGALSRFIRKRGVRTRRTMAVGIALAVVATVSGIAFADPKPDPSGEGVSPIAVTATPIESFQKLGVGNRTFDQLEWLGGLRLSSSNRSFGGWSGLAIDPDGRGFVAVSDAGTWMTGRIAYDGRRPSNITDTRIGPLLARDGHPLQRGRDRDAEAVALVSGTTRNGRLMIAFEQNHRIGRFAIGASGVTGPSSYIAPRQPGKRMPALRGFEAMTVIKGGRHDGSLVAIAERQHDASGHHTGWIWTGGKPRAFAVIDKGGHDITDAAALPGGGMILLERRFRWLEGIRFRLRYVPARELEPGAVIEGETLLEADLSYVIDNMEGLAVHEDGEGGFILSVLSDDNFNPILQQTLLLQFRWRPDDRQVRR